MTQPTTVGELKKVGWVSRPVKEEIRANAVAKIAAGEALFDGIYGYENTVLPQLENAVLAGHDIVFLGERGQAKSRMIRSLTNLLDEWMPYVAGSEIFDDPFSPSSRYAVDLLADKGDDTPLAWAHRDERYGEKLATPDTSIADLIGEVDPIKVAEGRFLSDELTIHYGLVPRTNRGIFAINELPDLAERIQVGLLNVLEERDVQIRGYKVRLPLDVMLVASANPEDYTNRGRIITPLKDRFGAQIRTHYPLTVDTEIDIAHAEVRDLAPEGVEVTVPEFMSEIVAQFSHIARASGSVNQRSGVSVRMTIANLETLGANAVRRGLLRGETEVAPRVSDLGALVTSTVGKIEIESLDESRDGEIVNRMWSQAVVEVFRRRFDLPDEPSRRRRSRAKPEPDDVPPDESDGAPDKADEPTDVLSAVTSSFGGGKVAKTGDDLTNDAYMKLLSSNKPLAEAASHLTDSSSPAELASALELVLEGLHLTKRLNKKSLGGDAFGSRAAYRARR